MTDKRDVKQSKVLKNIDSNWEASEIEGLKKTFKKDVKRFGNRKIKMLSLHPATEEVLENNVRKTE